MKILSFYKYLNKVQEECYRDPKIFHINSEVGPVVSSRDVRMGEKISKGIVMPLQFQFQKFFELDI